MIKENNNNLKLSELIAPHYHKTFLSMKTHQIDTGGRGSTKTSKNALKVVYMLLEHPHTNAVILRSKQNTLRRSVFSEIQTALKRLGLVKDRDFTAYVSPMEIRLYNGNTIFFTGGDDFNRIKGLTDHDNPIKIIWLEEVSEFVSPEYVENIIATFSRGEKDFFICLYTFNPPKNKNDWINQWLETKKQSPDTLHTHTTYLTVNPKWTGKLVQIAEDLKKRDPKMYRHIYLGEVIGIEGNIFNYKLVENIERIPQGERVIAIDFAIDSGHQVSATTCLAIGRTNKNNFYLLDTFYYSPNEKPIKKAPSDLSRDLFNFRISVLKNYGGMVDKETIDSAEGALRNQFFRDYGIKFHPVEKGKNKTELIDYTQNFLSMHHFKVIENNNNRIFNLELQDYTYDPKTLNTGNPKPDKREKPIKINYINTYTGESCNTYGDHTVDALQYWIKDNLKKLDLKV